MYGLSEYNNLISKYGLYASWAIWNPEKPSDTAVIDKNIHQLHSTFVLLGLNVSRSLTNRPWSNFHDNSHARKLRYACNNTKLRGSYITDLFKDIVEPKSNNLRSVLTEGVIEENILFFDQEMRDIQITDDTRFVIFGTPTSLLARCFNDYFKKRYKHQVTYYYHYSYFVLTDEQWVNGFWKVLGINQAPY